MKHIKWQLRLIEYFNRSFNMKAMIVLEVLAIFAVLTAAESQQPGSVQITPRIIGGEWAVDGQFPYQAAIRIANIDRHHCGAAIITGETVCANVAEK